MTYPTSPAVSESTGDTCRRHHAELRLELRFLRHRAERLAGLEAAVDDAHERDDAAVLVVRRVEDERARRRVGLAARRRNPLDDRVQHLLDTDPGLRGDAEDVLRDVPEKLRELGCGAVGVGLREVDLVRHRDDLELVVEGEVRVREGLRLDALGGVDEQERALAGLSDRETSYVKSTCPGVSIRFSSCPRQSTRTACALIVIPRSRSSSIESRICSRISRCGTASVSSRMRSASVDLPWSMCAMIAKLRIRSCFTVPAL